jgi:hypothetical protein
MTALTLKTHLPRTWSPFFARHGLAVKSDVVWYSFFMLKSNFSERRGKLSELDRSFDLAFWQSQPPAARFVSAWELVMHYARIKGLDVRQLRLHRSVESFQRQQR